MIKLWITFQNKEETFEWKSISSIKWKSRERESIHVNYMFDTESDFIRSSSNTKIKKKHLDKMLGWGVF